MNKSVLHTLLFLGIFSNLNAQVYPVQAFVQLTPPYTGYLPDYADPFNEQMKIILTLNDFAVPSYTVKIKLSITGSGFSMQTKPFISLPAIELTPGVPLQISGSDLAFYLSSTNLDITGLSVAEYEHKKVLPEGMYSICVQVLDYYSPTNLVLANSACASAWFTLQSPPLLNTPFCGTQITPTDPQMIIFNWSPLSMTWAGAITSTEYEFSLYEVRPADANANVVVSTTLPIYTTTTSQTFISYGITEPPLQVGMSYVWRVRAYDIGGRDAYLNNGYSQPCTFTYGNIASSLVDGITLNLSTNGTGTRQGLANWNATAAFSHYTLEVRKVGGATSTWFPYTSTTGILKVNGLEPSTQYEARVKGHAGEVESAYSNVATFTTLPLPNYACNNTVVPPLESTVHPLQNLILGNMVSTGQFEMMVTSVSSHIAPGVFSGFGKVNVPFMLLNFNVYFENIFIDDNMSMRSGRVVVLTNGVEGFNNPVNTLGLDINYTYPGNIDSLIVDGNGNLIIFDDGNQITIDLPSPMTEDYVVQDADGTIYIISPDGTVHKYESNITIELSATEKNIIRLALQNIEKKFDTDTINYLHQQVEESKSNLNFSSSSVPSGRPFLVRQTGIKTGDVLQGSYLESHTNYHGDARSELTAKTAKRFAEIFLDSENFSFIALYVKVGGMKLQDYIGQQLIIEATEQQIAKDICNEIISTINQSVKNEMYKN